MPDYKELYLTLMQGVEKSVEILIAAQRKCEDMYISSEDPNIHIVNFTQDSPDKVPVDEAEKQ